MGSAAGAQTLPRAARLRRAAEIQRVFEHGSRVERKAFVLLWRPDPGGRRAGFAVSRKVGGAAQRNRVRRRLREAYRRQTTAFPGDVMLVFVGRPAAGAAAFTELLSDMGQAGMLVEQRLERPAGAARPR
jgi:ribonuclease P protein component